MARGAAPRLVAGVTLVYFIVAVTAAPLQAQQVRATFRDGTDFATTRDNRVGGSSKLNSTPSKVALRADAQQQR